MNFRRSVITAELWRPDVAKHGYFVSNFCVFVLEKRSLSNRCYCADRTQNLPGSARHTWLTIFQILSKSVHFWRSYCRMREDRFCPVEYLQYRLFWPIKTGPLIWKCFFFSSALIVTTNTLLLRYSVMLLSVHVRAHGLWFALQIAQKLDSILPEIYRASRHVQEGCNRSSKFIL